MDAVRTPFVIESVLAEHEGYVLEPIVRIDQPPHDVVGHEILYRGPQSRTWIERDLETLSLIPKLTHGRPGFMTMNMSSQSIVIMNEERIEEAFRGRDIVVEWIEEMASQEQIMAAARRLRRWREKFGIRIAIDDMGTGHDGMERFLAVMPDIVKIEGSMLHRARICEVHERAVRNMVNFVRNENALVVMEWIETPQDYKLSRDMGANYGQGYLWSLKR